MIYYYGPVPHVTEQDFRHHYDVFLVKRKHRWGIFGYRQPQKKKYHSERYDTNKEKKTFPGNRLVLAPSCFFYPRLLVPYSSYYTRFLVKLVSVVGILGAASKNPKS